MSEEVVKDEQAVFEQDLKERTTEYYVRAPIPLGEQALRDFTLGDDAPEFDLHLNEEIVSDTFIKETILLKLKQPETVTPSTIASTNMIDAMARKYWNEYDRKEDLLRKYKDTYFPQVDQLVNSWGRQIKGEKSRLREDYILMEKGDELKKTESNQVPESSSSSRYLWRNIWDVARTEKRSNNMKDTKRMLELERHKNTRQMKTNHPSTCTCHRAGLLSCLHQRHQQIPRVHNRTSFRSVPPHVKPYFLLATFSEYEQHQGEKEEDLEASMVGDSYWTAPEKKRFFVALDRCGRHRVYDIAKRVGPTKTIQEVIVYLDILDQLAKVSPKEENDSSDLSAREMSTMFILQEERMASLIMQRLETESYKKHRELLLSKKCEKAEELFELWNMSSLTRLFVGTDDMTILISAIVQYDQLIRDFVRDIINTIYTEMTNEKDKLVTKERMNRVIAKRRETWKSLFTEKSDTRLKNMDVMGVIDRKRLFHEAFSRNKSASFLAKKRQNRWVMKKQKLNNGSKSQGVDQSREQNEKNNEEDEGDEVDGDVNNKEGDDDDRSEENQEERSTPNSDNSDTEEKDLEQEDNIPTEEEEGGSYVNSDSDTDLCEESDDGLDESDILDGEFYRGIGHESENELSQRLEQYESQLYSEQLNYSSEGEEDDDDEIEAQNKLLDKEYENQLSEQLGFIISN